MSLLEIAVLPDRAVPVAQILRKIESDPAFKIIPFSPDIAMEVAALGSSLRDAGDRAIVATARVHRLRLVTSGPRIIRSGLVPVIA